MSNMDIWNALAAPPEWAKKKISGGRLNGKTDINPQWRMRAMTERFGPVGEGWKYTIDKLWPEPGSDGQTMAMALVSVCWKTPDGWSEPIPGIGGSMLIEKEKSGMHTSDEGYKMAVTDALSVAFKALGVGADIYQGDVWASKYKDKEPKQTQPAKPTPKPVAPNAAEPMLTDGQRKTLMAIYGSAPRNERLADANSILLKAKPDMKPLTSFSELTERMAKYLIQQLDKMRAA